MEDKIIQKRNIRMNNCQPEIFHIERPDRNRSVDNFQHESVEFDQFEMVETIIRLENTLDEILLYLASKDKDFLVLIRQ